MKSLCLGETFLGAAEHYRSRLQDGRQVMLTGQKVENISEHPAFSGAVKVVENFYRLQSSMPDLHVCCPEQGDGENLVATSLLIPRSGGDLKRKRDSYKMIADLSFGMLGRTPDFMNAAISALGSHHEVLGAGSHASYSENAREYLAHCRRDNIFVGHGAINPQLDRSKSLSVLNHPFGGVRIVSQGARGLHVSGAKMIVTLGPLCDELLIFNMPGLQPGDEEFAVAFATPVNTAGLTLFCRKPSHQANCSLFDHPLANRFDEIDAYLTLDNIFVPWERVFVCGDVSKSNAFYDATFARNHTGHQGIVRGLAKAEIVSGIAVVLADALGSSSSLAVQEQLGELASFLEVTKALIQRSESEATMSPKGVITPFIGAIQATRWHFPKMYDRALQIIRSLAPGAMLSVPTEEDFKSEYGPLITSALSSGICDAARRTVLLNLAWDLVGDAFGQRQLAYEYYHAGEPGRISAGLWKSYDWSRSRMAAELGVSA